MAPSDLFTRYRDVIMDARDALDPRLLIAREGDVEVRYAPFDHVVPTARVILVGITPGLQQANLALSSARMSLQDGEGDVAALIAAKCHASFGGPMRSNLIEVLDHLGVQKALSIASCSSLWGDDAGLVQFTSALRYPVTIGDRNYSGSNPSITARPILLEQLRGYLGVEISSLPNARVVPLGSAAEKACRRLVRDGALDEERLIAGVAHPSPDNRQLLDVYLGRTEPADASARVGNPQKVLEDRERARAAVERWEDDTPSQRRSTAARMHAEDTSGSEAKGTGSSGDGCCATVSSNRGRASATPMRVVRIERVESRKGGHEEPHRTGRGFQLADPAHGARKHHAAHAVYAETLDEAGALVARGFSIWMTQPGKRASLVSPNSLRVVRG